MQSLRKILQNQCPQQEEGRGCISRGVSSGAGSGQPGLHPRTLLVPTSPSNEQGCGSVVRLVSFGGSCLLSHARALGQTASMQAEHPHPQSCACPGLQAACRVSGPGNRSTWTWPSCCCPLCTLPEPVGATHGAYLVVGDRFLLSQCTASKKAAFQNLSVCLQGRDVRETGRRRG